MDDRDKIRHMLDSMRLHTGVVRVMEICGTRTMALSKTGLRSILPENIMLLSGPGCPVCVTEETLIDTAIELTQRNVILASFGDMMKVRGTHESLMEQVKKQTQIEIVYSPLSALELAENISHQQVVFLAVGFETTAPLVALAVKKAVQQKLKNISFLMALKTMPPVLHKILQNNKKIDGIICPGHVSAVMGADYFRFIAEDYGIPAAICGFSAMDMTAGLFYLLRQTREHLSGFENLYRTCVNDCGNIKARQLMSEVFEPTNTIWRGIGKIRNSALKLKGKYSHMDAIKRFSLRISQRGQKHRCQCGEVLLGNIIPSQCRLFGTVCHPYSPKGPCMVSEEGACSAYYRYKI